jgi:hypothetical protein
VTKSKHERMIEADERGSRYLADANAAAERGDNAKAERLYEKGQFWLDRYNKLAGNA